MILKCKKSNRFLCEINIEEYVKEIRNYGISQEIPIRITIPCKNCKKIEIYDIYEKNYVYVKSIDKN